MREQLLTDNLLQNHVLQLSPEVALQVDLKVAKLPEVPLQEEVYQKVVHRAGQKAVMPKVAHREAALLKEVHQLEVLEVLQKGAAEVREQDNLELQYR